MDKLHGWLIYDKQGAEHNHSYIQMHMEEAKKLDMVIQLRYAEDFLFCIHNGNMFCFYEQKKIQLPDFVICRTIRPDLSAYLELLGIPVFNNAKVAHICNDKAKTHAYLAGKGIPMADTMFLKNKHFVSCYQEIPCQTVIKAVAGHGGQQVFCKTSENEEEIVKKIGSSDVVLQKLTGKSHQDVRVYVIGKEIIAAVCRTATSGFKSNFSLGGSVELYTLSQKQEAMVYKIIEQFAFGLVGIDFLIGEDGEFIFNEIEDVVGARMLYQCSNVNLVGMYLEFIKKKVCRKG